MKKMVGSIRYGLASLRRRAGEILKDEEGMGTVEVILIILEIFTRRKMLLWNFFNMGNKARMYIDYKEMS